jgi:hypothetical protein
MLCAPAALLRGKHTIGIDFAFELGEKGFTCRCG